MKIPEGAMIIDENIAKQKLMEFFVVSSKLHEARKKALAENNIDDMKNIDRILDEGIGLTKSYLELVEMMGDGHIPPRSEMN
jgi:hypothetical protein